MKLSIFQADAFTDKVFGGNPAAICPLEEWIDAKLMQHIAAENNLSETVFFVPKEDKFEIRWFTPETEIDLCGHATLATAHILYQHLGFMGKSVTFQYGGGQLQVEKDGDRLRMNFPATPPKPVEAPGQLVEALGKKPMEAYKSRDYLLIFESQKDIEEIKPVFHELLTLDTLGFIVSAPGHDVDFVSRFFAPGAGINEDPVTGSAHCTLIPYWSKKLQKTRMTALQLSKRKGEIHCEFLGDRVIISGKAVTYLQGSINF